MFPNCYRRINYIKMRKTKQLYEVFSLTVDSLLPAVDTVTISLVEVYYPSESFVRLISIQMLNDS